MIDCGQYLNDHLRNSPLAIVEFDPRFRVVRWSEESEKMFGWRAEEIIGKSIFEMKWVHEADTAQVSSACAGLREGTGSRSMNTNRNYRKDGRVLHCRWYNSALYDDDGNLVSILSQVLDVTAQKEAEEALQKAEKTLRRAQSAARIGSWWFDPKTQIPLWSDEMFRVFGMDPAPEAPSYADHRNFIHPDDWSLFDTSVTRAVKEGIGYSIELRVVHPDGRTGYVHAICEPQKNERGEVVELIGTTQDITERREREEKARYLQRRLESLWKVSSLRQASFKKICDTILSEILEMTESRYGFYGFLDDTEDAMKICSWSEGALEACRIQDKPLVFPIESSGIWGNAVRRREPFVLNDYQAPCEHKKGLPEGHVPLTRIVSVPVIVSGKVVAVGATANKKSPYTAQDVHQLQAFLASCQIIIDRKATEEKIKNTLQETETIRTELDALLKATQSVLSSDDFVSCARAIFDECCNVTGASSGYVALLNETGEENDVLLLEAGGWPCSVDPTLPMPIRGVRAEAYKTGKAVFDNNFINSKRQELMPEGHAAPDNVLFAPLNIDGKTVGLIGLADKQGGFDEQDARIAEAFGEIGAIALKNRRNIDQLVKSEEKFAKSFQKSPLTMTISDIDTGRYLDVNEQFCRDFGFSREEVVGKTSVEIGLLTEAARNDLKAELVREGSLDISEIRFRKKNGDDLVAKFFSQTIHYDGKPRLLSIVQDITAVHEAAEEKEILETQLRQAQKMEALGTLAGGIAHDFNNLLGVIIGYTDLIKEDAPMPDAYRKDLERVLQAANRAKDLVHQILTFSRQSQTEVTPLNPVPIIREALKMLRSSIPSTIEIRDSISEDCGNIEAEPTQLHQILMNLCINAFHAMESSGGILEVTLAETEFVPPNLKMAHTESGNGLVQLTVRDTGCGIPAEDLEKIFDPFFTTKEQGKGTGMGLSIVYGIVKNYGGVVTVDSRPGKGASFHVFFPKSKNEPIVTSLADAAVPLGKEHILFVDDEPLLADMATKIFERLGYRVTAKTKSVEALELFRSQSTQFDIVVTDHTMPGITGLEMAQLMKKIRPDIPIVLCTGYSHQVDENIAAEGDVTAFVLKPFTKALIAPVIRNALDGRC